MNELWYVFPTAGVPRRCRSRQGARALAVKVIEAEQRPIVIASALDDHGSPSGELEWVPYIPHAWDSYGMRLWVTPRTRGNAREVRRYDNYATAAKKAVERAQQKGVMWRFFHEFDPQGRVFWIDSKGVVRVEEEARCKLTAPDGLGGSV